jgi:Galactose oxidase, central domain/Dockerin type I domain
MHHPIQLSKTTSSSKTSPVTWPNDNKTIGTRLPALIAGFLPVVSILARRIAAPLLLLTAGMVLVQPCAGQSGTWTETGGLHTARSNHTVTLLPNGKVLVAGGFDCCNVLASAELYDPTSGTWSATGSLGTARYNHTATLLPNGKVLVAGGSGSDYGDLASAELYDPTSGTWSATGSLGTARLLHTATLLPNGKVLVAGGINSGGYLASAELYNPASGTWSATGSLGTARYLHTATLLPNGKVLVAGGGDSNGILASAELYDPASGTWAATGSLGTARYAHTATLLPNGKVLVAGGGGIFFGTLASVELYDPASGTWTAAGSLITARWFHTATLLPNGKVLVAGGAGDLGTLASAELYSSDGGGGLALMSAASVQRGFAIDLPLTGPSGVEDRSTLPNHKLTITMTFNSAIASVGGASSTCGGVQSISINGNTVTVKLVGVPHGCNGHDAEVTANDVMDDMGNTLSSATATVGLLLGDANGDRVVNHVDRAYVQSYKGQRTDSANFRADVNNDGYVGSKDVQLVIQQQGTSLGGE